MTRRVANAYFNRTLLETVKANAAQVNSPCFVWTMGLNECLLGCALHSRLRLAVRLLRTSLVDGAASRSDASGGWVHLVRGYSSASAVRRPTFGGELTLLVTTDGGTR
jgi:hypothetical protein